MTALRVILGLVSTALVLSHAAAAQSPETREREHAFFECREDGLARGQRFGCQLVASPQYASPGDPPIYWHLTRFKLRREAEAAKRAADAVIPLDGEFWVTRLGSRGDTLTRGIRVAPIGPLELPPASRHQMALVYVVMPAGARTVVHTHPGPEAWYVLEGEQCLATPVGAIRAKAGEGAVAPPGGTPMQLVNTGSVTRRALFIVVHDPALPRSAASDWQPTGCD